MSTKQSSSFKEKSAVSPFQNLIYSSQFTCTWTVLSSERSVRKAPTLKWEEKVKSGFSFSCNWLGFWVGIAWDLFCPLGKAHVFDGQKIIFIRVYDERCNDCARARLFEQGLTLIVENPPKISHWFSKIFVSMENILHIQTYFYDFQFPLEWPYLGSSLHSVALVQHQPRVPPVPIDGDRVPLVQHNRFLRPDPPRSGATIEPAIARESNIGWVMQNRK